MAASDTMCTICGIVTDAPDPEHLTDLLAMLQATRHRGPDACGAWSAAARERVTAPDPEALAPALRALGPAPVLVAQSRLAITGGADALQPFMGLDGRLAFAHNGEIYNHDELRRVLPPGTPGVETGCDSEVLARIVERFYDGDLPRAVRRAVTMADGMYALAVSDGETLVLARDPIGKKPIYYCDGRTFAFASERKALVRVAAREGSVVKRLPPGHVLTVRPGQAPRVEPFEAIPAAPVDILDMDTAVRMYEETLQRAITRRARRLKRAAVLFSGGVDSVLVARMLQRAGLEVTGYAMGMDGSGDVKAAEAAARDMGMALRVARVDAEMLERDLPDIVRASEIAGPLQVEVAIPMWYASRMAHEDGHRVIFTGQAADELFAGYDWYRKVVAEKGHVELHARLWDDVRALPVDTLEREDRITMAHELELRAPFLDQDVIRLAMRVAPQLKLHGPDDLMRKHPHRQAALRLGVPAHIALREKSPAQEGASVHTLLEQLARRRFPEGVAEEVAAFADFGSNYRYRDTLGKYATREVHALLQAVVREHGIAVVDERAELPPPAPAPGEVRPLARPPRAA